MGMATRFPPNERLKALRKQRLWTQAQLAEEIPATKDIYKRDVNLASLHAPAGQIKISFDVYDLNGDSNLAPNGEHVITYSP
jgi:transcriptional regulator with XRE-family HTH domain